MMMMMMMMMMILATKPVPELSLMWKLQLLLPPRKKSLD
jgi:hypothetical protein